MEKDLIRPGIVCTRCGHAYPARVHPFQCPDCGGLFDFSGDFYFNPALIDHSLPGIWCYQHAFGLSLEVEPVSLGEGSTPLVWAEVLGRRVAFKCEYLNPSGSFKDRGSALIVAWLRNRGVAEVVEDSSGNAGASLAAYAARAGIKAHIFIPESASGPKRIQIEAYGAEAVPVAGSRTAVSEAVRKVVEAGVAYASHAWLPFNLPGYATAAYEIFEQLGQMPGAVLIPAGQGGLLLGLARGFNALRIANNLVANPLLIGVQSKACDPLVDKFNNLDTVLASRNQLPTLAEGVQVCDPLRNQAVIAAVTVSRGWLCAIEEAEILPARNALARLGLYVEPTSAIVYAALSDFINDLPDPIVLILTGSGMKYG